MGSLSNLTRLRLKSNDLSGEIPAELGSLSNLTELDLYGNNLSGEIPAELGSLSNLTRLRLDFNELSLCVPRSLEDHDRFGNLSDPALLLKPRALSWGDGRHIIQEALTARVGYGAWCCPSPDQVRSRLIVLIPAPGCTAPPWCCCIIGRAT